MFEQAARQLFLHVVPLVFVKPPTLFFGTGTILGRHGVILTANHVIPEGDGSGLMAGRNYGDQLAELYNTSYRVIDRFPEHDLALMHCATLPLDDIEEQITFGWEELFYGFPLGSYGYPQPRITKEESEVEGNRKVLISADVVLRFKSYFVAGLTPDYEQESPGPYATRSYMLDSFAYGGHSGGPVFDADGRLFAVMSKTQLHERDRREISYCEATATANIKKELDRLL